MSRIGKKLIPIPSGVTITNKGDILEIKGPKGILTVVMHEGIEVNLTDKEATVINRGGDLRPYKALHGLVRSLLANAVTGVSTGFTNRMELVGVGYRAEVKNNGLDLTLGYSHPVRVPFPEGISAEIEKGTNILIIRGVDKQRLGQYCADVRKLRPPEPYKGKGFRFEHEKIRRKSGKTV